MMFSELLRISLIEQSRRDIGPTWQADSRCARSAAIARKVATSVGMRIAHNWAQHGEPRDECKFPPGLPNHIELALDTAGLPRL